MSFAAAKISTATSAVVPTLRPESTGLAVRLFKITTALMLLMTAIGCHASASQRAVDGGSDLSDARVHDAIVVVDPPSVYVAKVKDILVGLPPNAAEIAMVEADPQALRTLIDTWMALPQYDQKMQRFFQLAFQQTQISLASFGDTVPPAGIGPSPNASPLLQNIEESFARTVMEEVRTGQPLNAAFTTHEIMMTPALMELYAFLDAYQVDNAGTVHDAFAAANPGAALTFEVGAGPIPAADSADAASPNFLHWYDPDISTATTAVPGCVVDPIVMPATAINLHFGLYGFIRTGRVTPVPSGSCPVIHGTAAGMQLAPSDFTTWNLVTIRQPMAGEPTTKFYDLAQLRTATTLVLNTPRVGYFTTPAFEANWPTNSSNQMRVTVNQALIVATNAFVDGADPTMPATTPGLDDMHSQQAFDCFRCHRTLDPTRSILASTYSWFYDNQKDAAFTAEKGLFAFQGVVANVNSVDDFAMTLSSHPLFAPGWVQKFCYYANSAACSPTDPEFQRVVSVFEHSSYSWNTLVKELLSSPMTTNASVTETEATNGEVIAVRRVDQFCAAVQNRLGLTNPCGTDITTAAALRSSTRQIISGLPSDGYGRGAAIPVLPNQPTLFYRAAIENICEAVSSLVIDAQPSASEPNLVRWSSATPDVTIANIVETMMALPASDPRSAPAQVILKSHFTSAMQAGHSASTAMKSTFIASCLSPSFMGIGM